MTQHNLFDNLPPHCQSDRPATNERAAKDEALERVTTNAGQDWQSRAAAILRELGVAEIAGEDLRLECQRRGITPHHHNAWGGLIAGLVKSGALTPTGRYAHMKAPGSHARKTAVYRIGV